jgi:hypothetical protein
MMHGQKTIKISYSYCQKTVNSVLLNITVVARTEERGTVYMHAISFLLRNGSGS